MTFSVVTAGGRVLSIFIVPLWKRELYHPPVGKGALIPPPFFHHTIRYRAAGALPEAAIAFKIKCEIMS